MFLFLSDESTNSKTCDTFLSIRSYTFDCFLRILGSIKKTWSDDNVSSDKHFQLIFSSIVEAENKFQALLEGGRSEADLGLLQYLRWSAL